MFTETYIEALLVDEHMADKVWDKWNSEEMTYEAARIAWLMIAGLFWPHDQHGDFRGT